MTDQGHIEKIEKILNDIAELDRIEKDHDSGESVVLMPGGSPVADIRGHLAERRAPLRREIECSISLCIGKILDFDDDWHQADDPKRVAALAELLTRLRAIGCPDDLLAKGFLRRMWSLHVMRR